MAYACSPTVVSTPVTRHPSGCESGVIPGRAQLFQSPTISTRACGLAGYRNDGEFSVGRHLRDALSAPIMINNDRILANTATFVIASIAGQFLVGFGLALFFWTNFPGASWLRGLFLVSWVMPGLVVGAIWNWILSGDFGVLNFILRETGLIGGNIFWRSDPGFSLWAVIIANIWLGLAFNMLLLAVGLAGIPKDLYEAAELDGANAPQRFWTITLPMMRSTIGAVLALGLIGTLQQFDLFPAITEGGPANSSTVAQYWAWQMSFKLYDFARGATISVLMLILVLVASLVYVRSTRHEHAA